MKLLSVAELALRVKMSPVRSLEKARRGQLPQINMVRGPKVLARFDLEALLKALQGDSVSGTGDNYGTIATAKRSG